MQKRWGMDATRWTHLEALFAQAVELPPRERSAFCDWQCAGDRELHTELTALLSAHANESPLLDNSLALSAIEATPQADVPAGTRIGVWRVGAPIRRGGAGEVYHAERADGAFEQHVALKLLYREGAPDVERFHAERRILASLEHPGIARLLDGGVSDDGRLYAVVEYVDGQPLTEHCNAIGADLATRLALFVQVCEVVTHAHRHLIVHRDLKPGNVLVTSDGRVKLLDFGVAKRLDRGAADETHAPYTPDYAAPEQLTGGRVTTATDVYALGVLLFELLTGQRPWRSEGMPIARLVQAIVHEEPVPASSVVSATAPVAPRQIAGDLDAIIATCLRKNAADRYPTVEALQRDIERHRASEPVAARGRARSYVLGRALRRYRWGVAAGALVFASLAAGLAATLWQAQRAQQERDAARDAAAREEAVRYHITNLFRSSIAQQGTAPVTAKEMLDRSAKRVLEQYRDDPQLKGKVVIALADLYSALQDFEGQAPLLEGFVASTDADTESLAMARQRLAQLEITRGHAPRAAELLAQAEAFWATAPQRFVEPRLQTMLVRGLLQRTQGTLDASIATYRAAIAERIAHSGLAHRETGSLHNSLAITLTAAGRLDEALQAYRQSLAIYEQLGQTDEPDALVILANTGMLALRTGRLREAEQTLKAAVEKQRARAGDSAAVAAAMGVYGTTLLAYARDDEALAIARTALDMAVKFVGEASPLAVQSRIYLTDALSSQGALDEARQTADENFKLALERYGPASIVTLRVKMSQARLHLRAGRAADAQDGLATVLEPLRRLGRSAQPALAQALADGGEAMLARGLAAEAVAPLRESVALRESWHWEQSWELAEARALLGEALLRSGGAGGAELHAQASTVLASQLGAAHPRVLRLRRGSQPPR
jgi:eukaryotic-like serine/threonine-protein kinase